jgi:outer membrane receptor protein involved in Fe transport
MRKTLLLSVVSAFFILNVSAQNPAGNRGAAAAGGGQMAGRFYGKIVEAKSGKAIEAASVQLVQNKFDSATRKRKEVVIAGMLTKPNGEFSLENIPMMGQFKLRVSAIGLKQFEKPVSFQMNTGGDMSAMLGALDQDLGNLKLEIDEKVLENVSVTSSKPGLQLGIDRKIFNVDKNIVSQGGTAVDIMRNIPSLQVDIDGNVTMRNNTPQVFIDGRPTTLTLEQIPADAIESVEMITNPSAKFDASGGTAGILNVVLKKAKKVGYNGSVRANVDSRARIGGGGDFNIRGQKLNLFGNAMYNQRKSISTGNTTRLTLIDNPDTYLSQKDKNTSLGNFRFVRLGADFFIDNRNTLTVNGNFVKGKFEPVSVSDILIDTLGTPKTSSFNQRISNTAGEFRNMGSQLSFKHNFPKAGREWTADATFNASKNNNSNNIQTDIYSLPAYIIANTAKQQQITNGTNKNITVQTDYTTPLSDKSKLELGARANFREVNSVNNFFFINPVTGQSTYSSLLSVKYNSTDRVYAAYANYSNKIKDFGYQLGLRAESSNYEGVLPDKNQNFKIDFPISLFPSIFLSQKLKKNQDLQLNYSRRINRPNFFQLFPFTDYSDSLNLSRGNPNLKPEFTNSFELSYQKTFEKNSNNILASLYFKNTNNLITRYQVKEINPVNGKDILINTYINADNSYVTGLELTAKIKMAAWWDMVPNVNLFTSKITINDPTQADPDQFASWFGKLNNTFKLPKNFTLQLSGEYQSKTLLPPGGSGGGGGGRGFGGGGGFGGGFGQTTASQGFVRPNYFVDMGLRYEFLKNKVASISVNWNDIFRTRRTNVFSESSFFQQNVFRRRDPQVVRVNFNWRFGKFDASLFKRKNLKGEREGMQGAGEGIQQ